MIIPDPSARFRIRGAKTGKVLVSRLGPKPTFTQIQDDGEFPTDYQLFKAQPAGPPESGLFFIVSVATGKRLFSRSSQEPRVGHIKPSSSSPYEDNFFRLEHLEDGAVRIISNAGAALVSSPERVDVTNQPVGEYSNAQRFFLDIVRDDLEYEWTD